MYEIVLNYEGFRSKFHIYRIHQPSTAIEGERAYSVAKQLLDRHAFRWGNVTDIDPNEPFREAVATEADLHAIFESARGLAVPLERSRIMGKDGDWFSLRIKNSEHEFLFSWWSNHEPELQPVYDLKDKIIETVMRLLRKKHSED